MKVILLLFLFQLITCRSIDSDVTPSSPKFKIAVQSALKKVILPDICATKTNCSSIIII